MKCKICKQQFRPIPGVWKCSRWPEKICNPCVLKSKELHKCSMVCQSRLVKNIDYQPLIDGFMGFGSMAQVTITTEECLPSIFRFVYAKISDIDIRLNHMNSISVDFKMQLFGAENLPNQLYQNENWKTMHLVQELKNRKITDKLNPAPIFAFRASPYLRIQPETLNVSIGGVHQSVAMSDRHEYIGTPVSDPPPDNFHPEIRGVYNYYGGKFTSIYAPFVIDSEYEISFDVEAVNPMYALGFLFPYANVDISGIAVGFNPITGVAAASPVFAKNNPVTASILTPEFEYKLNRPDDEMPEFEKADPFRKTLPIIKPEIIDFYRLGGYPGFPVRLRDYQLIDVQFGVAFDMRKIPTKLIVQSKITDRDIPIRTYQKMQTLPEYRDFLIELDLFNLDSESSRKLQIDCEIVGFTEIETKYIEVPKLHGDVPARKIIQMCPQLKSGLLESMAEGAEAELKFAVYEKINGRKTILHQGSKTVRLLSNEQIIWQLNDVTSGATYRLEPTLTSWIQTNDELISEVLEKSNKYHLNQSLHENADGHASLEEKTEDVKAIYECLNLEYGIKYSDEHAFQYGDPVNSQRILTAKRVIESKSGLCIDFVILFSALLERIGINPYLILTQEHAFLGWGKDDKLENIRFLETTALGGKIENLPISFDMASQKATEIFKSEFMLGNDSRIMGGLLAYNGKVIVSLEKAREDDSITRV